MTVLDWQIGMFCKDEGARVVDCLHSVARALAGRAAVITVVVNGSTDGSAAAVLAGSRGLGVPVEVFEITFADKSNAINCFLHDRRLRREAAMYGCVDGYVTINVDAFAGLEAALAAHPEALAVSGVAGNGRSSVKSTRRALVSGGALHGQLHAFRAEFVERLLAAGYRLPTRLYRGDGLLGSMVAHNLDPLGTSWNSARLIATADAVFELQALSLFRFRDLRRHFYRKNRQMRGLLETAAIKDLIYAGGYAALPGDADEMIAGYLARQPAPRVPLLDRPFMALALRQHRRAGRVDPAWLEPTAALA